MNTFATVVVYFLVALFVLHLIDGTATSWIKSKFNTIATTNNPNSSGGGPLQPGPPVHSTPNPLSPGLPSVPTVPGLPGGIM